MFTSRPVLRVFCQIVFVFPLMKNFTGVPLRKITHISNGRFIHFNLRHQMLIIKISKVCPYKIIFVCIQHVRIYFLNLETSSSVWIFMHLIYWGNLMLAQSAVGRRYARFSLFFLIGLYDICLFNSTYILKAITICNICFYLTTNENY